MSEYSAEFLALLESVTAKRPRTVIQHILKNGYITSQELKDVYGYNHPPRAVRDVREYGIPLVTYRVQGADGRSIAAYKFGNPNDGKNALSKASGRTVLSKALKQALIEKYGAKCFIYLEKMDDTVLQVDHRVPYEIGGEHDEKDIDLPFKYQIIEKDGKPSYPVIFIRKYESYEEKKGNSTIEFITDEEETKDTVIDEDNELNDLDED